MRASGWAQFWLFGLLAACARSPSRSSGASGSASPATSALASNTAAATSAWQVGKQYPYRFVLSTALSMNDNPAFDFDLSGTLRVVPASSTPNGVELYLTIDGAKAVSRIPSSQAELDKAAQQVSSTGCFLDLEDGKVSALHAPNGLSPLAANIYRELGADLQFAYGGATPYTAQEYDTTGQYLAEYTPLAGGLHFQKRKQRYLAVLNSAGASSLMPNAPAQIVPQILASDADITLGTTLRPSIVHAKNQLLVNGAQVPVRSTTQVSLEAGDEQQVLPPSPDFVALLGKTSRVGASEPYGGQISVDALDDARIHGETFASLYAQLAALPQTVDTASSAKAHTSGATPPVVGAKTTDQSARVFIALAALFRRQPQTIELALQKIRSSAPGSDELLDALGSASSPASQHALLGLLKDKNLSTKVESRVMRSLSRSQRPTQESVDALEALLANKPFDQVPLFGLGTYCRRLREEGELDRSDAVGEILLQRLSAAQGQPALLNVLDALSNAGYPKAFAPLQAYLQDKRETVRAAAVRGLQSIKDPEVDPVLARVVKSEPSSEVRIAAMDAAQIREPTEQVARALAATAVQASDPRVRFRAVELMSQWLQRWPAFRRTLEGVASNDAEGKVRDLAKAAL